MARYGKTINLIEGLYDKTSHVNSHEQVVQAKLTRNGREVYRVVQELLEQSYFITKLYHYETLILSISEYPRETVIDYYYGMSSSDRDAMNTMLDCLSHNPKEYFILKQGDVQLVGE